MPLPYPITCDLCARARGWCEDIDSWQYIPYDTGHASGLLLLCPACVERMIEVACPPAKAS